jgi:hypothetical protein
MALNITATPVSNLTAQPQIIANASSVIGASEHVVYFNVPVATGNLAVNSLFYVLPLAWTARLTSISLGNDVILDSNGSPTLALDLGVYQMNYDGSFTVEAGTIYGSAIAFGSAANLSGTELIGNRAFTKIGNEVWQDAGLSSPPSGNLLEPVTAVFVIKIHTAAATAAAGNISVKIKYVF